MITSGQSGALVYRIEIKEKPYLLRIIPDTNVVAAKANLSYYFSYMRIASEAEIAPKIQYLSIENKLSITHFIESKPFPLDEARNKLPILLRKLHSLPGFHSVMNIFEIAGIYIQKLKALNILPDSEISDMIENYKKIASVYPLEKEGLVSCHNDLKPENIIYDGKKPWIVDWEAAFLNLRYADLSIVVNFIPKNQSEEIELLKSYFDREPTDYDLACFYLIQQILHINYFTVFLVILSSKGKSIDLDKRPDCNFSEFHNRMWKGEISLAEDESRLYYALVHKDKYQNNIKSQRFKNALDIVLKMNIN